jgi:uridine phosphorylase
VDFKTRTVKTKLRRLRIIRLGTTGALQETIPLNSIIVNTHAVDLTGLMLYYIEIMNGDEKEFADAFAAQMKDKIPQIPVSVHAGDKQLIEVFSQIPNCIKGVCVSCNGFYAPQGRRLRVDTLYGNLAADLATFRFKNHLLTNIEMETSALYGLSKILGHQCCSVNIVLGHRVKKQFVTSSEEKDQLIEYSLEALANLPQENC